MAKPKGATLTRLFAVSDEERQEFWAKIQAKGTDTREQRDAGIPVSGTPLSGPPVTGAPDVLPSEAEQVLTPEVRTAGRYEPGIPESGAPATDTAPQLIPFNRKIRETHRAQDGHSLGEQAVYTALWSAGQQHSEDCRRITIGYRTLSDVCGLTVNNCKANIQALRRKLAIEEADSHTNSKGTTYRVYSYAAILRRRRQAGMTHVIRTRGVMFVNSETGVPVSGIPVSPSGAPDTGIPKQRSGTPVPDKSGIPISDTDIRNKNLLEEQRDQETSPSAFSTVISTARLHGVLFDDDAARRLVLRCQTYNETATHEEVAYFVGAKILQLRHSRNVDNLVGLLIKAVPEFFVPPATELQRLRKDKAEESKRSRELARSILEDPESSTEDREWAAAFLGGN
jgi:hypothetical protein